MSSLMTESHVSIAIKVETTKDSLIVDLLDEDVSVENLLTAKHSGETQKSFKKWLASRT